MNSKVNESWVKAKKFRDINKMREGFGMPLIKRGYKSCKRCSVKFYAVDMVNQYFCRKCNKIISG